MRYIISLILMVAGFSLIAIATAWYVPIALAMVLLGDRLQQEA